MPLFQKSVLNKYLKEQDKTAAHSAYEKYRAYFHNPQIQQNIRESKEEQFQEGFLRELFVNVFGFVLNPQPDFNLTTEYKNEKGAKKADGAVLKEGKAIAVIELKSTKTKDLESIRQQAFDYKANQTGCVYVVTSNFQKLRFYINDAVEFEEFDLFILSGERFEVLFLCLNSENLLTDLPLKIKNASILEEEQITKKFYADYSLFKKDLFESMVRLNMEIEGVSKLLLYKKTQKLLDRFLFIFFAEDRGLLPPNSISRMIKRWNVLKDEDAYKPLYEIYKQYFGYLNKGRKGKVPADDIHEYNGGLFLPDELLDKIEIEDEVLLKHTSTLTNYDFDSSVDVNILGHIFEHSLNEIESTTAELQGVDFDKQKSKRKKDGVFYTPKYITKYIVDNTVGKLCEEKKTELGIRDDEFTPSRQKATKKKLLASLETYRSWLLELTICDPACGSGAFLNQALEFLIREHHYIDELNARLFGSTMVFQDVENRILENNIFGVDINEESVDIARLSLWLRTAQRGRKLTTLNKNIKCGNSLIDDPAVAGDKAFKWEEEFPNIFKEKEKKAWHVTFALHNSRYAGKIREGGITDGLTRQLRKNEGPGFMGYTHLDLTGEEEIILAEEMEKAAKKYALNILECNICADHVHAIIVCEKEELSALVGMWKGRGAYTCNRRVNPSVDEQEAGYTDGTKEKFWAKSFHKRLIDNPKQLENAINYIRHNRQKHELPAATDGLTRPLVNMSCTHEHAFRTEYKGGFDVVIGNPPYVRVQNLDYETIDYYKSNYSVCHQRTDLYLMFFERGFELLNKNGFLSYINPILFINSDYGRGLRNYLITNGIYEIIDFGDLAIFEDVITYTGIFTLQKQKNDSFFYKKIDNITDVSNVLNSELREELELNSLTESNWTFISKKERSVLEKIKANSPLKEMAIINSGCFTGFDNAFFVDENEIANFNLEKELVYQVIMGKEPKRYFLHEPIKKSIYPYECKNNKTELINEEEFENKYPNAYNYLVKFKRELLGRKDSRKSFEEMGRPWYSYTRKGLINVFKSKKILVGYIVSGNTYCLDTNSNMFSVGRVFGIVPRDLKIIYSLLAILNSKISMYLMMQNCPIKKGGYFKISSKYLAEFPIPDVTNITELGKKSMEQIRLNSNLNNSYSHYIKYISLQIGKDYISNKILNWHELEFSEFIKELNKAIKKSGGKKLSKMDEMEWMEVFENKKTEAQSLKAQIEKTDKEIDQMVYELYGLTEEEIGIVEQSN